jgi:hybrid cluster-associated redox disulfide protein
MISAEMKIDDILRRYPSSGAVLREFGLDCTACSIASYEDLAHAAAVHKVDLAKLLAKLNAAIS